MPARIAEWKPRDLRVVVVGAGYVGLVSAVCLAELGHWVTCIDLDSRRIAALRAGAAPIYEAGLDTLLLRHVSSGRLTFATELPPLADTEVVIIAVGTPPRPDGRGADLSAVMDVARTLAPRLVPRTVVAIKSTVPPGTGDAVERLLRELRPDLEPTVVSNPEFLREGAAVGDFLRPDRLVIGCEAARGRLVMHELYRPLTLRRTPVLSTSRRTAELVKYASNAFLATKIGFINEMADLCEALHADVEDVARGMGLDRRIGPAFLQAGPGYGGSCFPKDTAALLDVAERCGAPLQIVGGVAAANAARQADLTARACRALGGAAAGKTVALLGLAFKPDTDDVRDSPALALISGLREVGAAIRVFDPAAAEPARLLLDGVTFAEDPYDCVVGADLVVLVTHWAEFRRLDAGRMARLVQRPVILDLRNAFNAATLARAGFTVHGVGRPPHLPDGQAAPLPAQPLPYAAE